MSAPGPPPAPQSARRLRKVLYEVLSGALDLGLDLTTLEVPQGGQDGCHRERLEVGAGDSLEGHALHPAVAAHSVGFGADALPQLEPHALGAARHLRPVGGDEPWPATNVWPAHELDEAEERLI